MSNNNNTNQQIPLNASRNHFQRWCCLTVLYWNIYIEIEHCIKIHLYGILRHNIHKYQSLLNTLH